MFKEIVTKAVIGKAKKTTTAEYTLTPEEKPDTVLGCWIINHKFRGSQRDDKVIINGTFDVNLWYSYDDNTKTAVSTQKFNYDDLMKVPLKDDNVLTTSSEIMVKSLKQPTVTNVKCDSKAVVLTIEKELGVEIIGDTKLTVSIGATEDEYEEIEDNNEIDENLANLNENYIETSTKND